MASFDPKKISRPDPSLLKYYALSALIAGPGFPFAFLPLYFKYKTLTYRFDDSGVSVCWGILFRREVYLTYRRIQDIHVTRNIVQRWMGLATLAIQTASGSATPEMSIEGILEAEPLRDYLYTQMRGTHLTDGSQSPELAPPDAGTKTLDEGDETLAVLIEIRDVLRQLETQRKGIS